MPEQPVSNLAVYSARPTLKVDGQENEEVHRTLVSLEMVEGEGGMSSLELRLENWVPRGGQAGLAWDDGSVFKLGAALTVLAGDEESPQEIFRGAVTGLEGHFPDSDAPQMVVLAEDALQRARMARRTAVYTDTTLAALAQRVAGQLSLTPKITALTAQIGTQAQLNESDLAFLRRVLAGHDADLQVVGAELHVAPRGQIQRGQVELRMHGQLREARFMADLSHQVTKTTATGWDPLQGSAVQATGSGAQLGPGQGKKGSEWLQQALGARSEHVRDLAVMSRDEAQALADAAFDQRARRFVRVEGSTEGNAALRVGTHLKITDASPLWDNTYYVTRAVHRFDREDGYRTEFEAECAYLGSA